MQNQNQNQPIKATLAQLVRDEDGLSFVEFASFVAVVFAAGAGVLYMGATTLMGGMMPAIKM